MHGGAFREDFTVVFQFHVTLLLWLCYDPKWWKENRVGVDLRWGGGGVDRTGWQPGLEPSLNDYPCYQIGLG